MKSKVLYADFPYQHSSHKGSLTKAKENGIWGLADNHYKRMTWKEIKEFPIDDYAEKDCALFLWSSPPVTKRFMEIMENEWKFEYKTFAFAWVKQNKDGTKIKPYGLGHYTLSNIEVVLLGIRGKFNRVSKSVPQIVVSPVTRHSEKPDIVRDRIVQLCGDVSRTELFARKRVIGWEAMGDQLPALI